MVSVVFRDVGVVREGRRYDVVYRYKMTQPWWVMDQSEEKNREVVRDLRTIVGQDEDMRTQLTAASYHSCTPGRLWELCHSIFPQLILIIFL